MALAFVPVDDVITAFLALLDLSNDYPELDEVFAYLEDTYIGRAHGERRLRLRYSIQCWNEYNRVISHLPRTNNAIEGWHRAFQNSIACNHPTVYSLINQFRTEQDFVELILQRIRAGEEFPQFSSQIYAKVSERIERVVEQYNNLPILDYLRGVAHNLNFLD